MLKSAKALFDGQLEVLKALCYVEKLEEKEMFGSKTIIINGKEVPVIPPLPVGQPELDPNPTIAVCGECGLELKKVMMYSCGNIRCPVQPKAIC